MSDYIKPLGDSVRKARATLNLTQNEVADKINVDVRTILNIENYRGNPKLEVLFPLIRVLNINAKEIFYPEQSIENPTISQLHLLIDSCSEQEAQALIQILNTVLAVLRSEKYTPIK